MIELMDKAMTAPPTLEIFDKETVLVLKTAMPGMQKEDVHVDLVDGYIVIKADTEVKKDPYYSMERSFYEAFQVPFEVTPAQVTATLTDGVLEVQIPKPAPATPPPTPPATTIPVT